MDSPNAGARREKAEQLAGLAGELRGEVIGQDHVIAPVAEWVIHGELGLTSRRKPRGSFMFLGPTGVGKTQLVKALARRLSPGGEHARFDLSEFQTRESVDVFLGRGTGDEGRFGAELARVPGGRVLLFDEFEKAHPQLLDLLLQMLDEGRLTVASGRTYDLRALYVALTSNLGAGAAARMRHNSDSAVERTVLAHARQHLRPELFARVDLVCVFRRLALRVQEEICRYHVGRKLAELRAEGIEVTIDPAAIQFILGEGFSEWDGARPLERAIQNLINRPLVAAWTAGKVGAGCLTVNAAGTGLEFAGPGPASVVPEAAAG
jgi:ATP-dependent Clp protease ATP-binding subunit ClpB